MEQPQVPVAASVRKVDCRSTPLADPVPTFDPNADRVLTGGGGPRPDEQYLTEVFACQDAELDRCVGHYKAEASTHQLVGEGLAQVLLNPSGRTPLGVNLALPEGFAGAEPLLSCLRLAVARAPYPKYDGPPIVVEFEFDLDPGYADTEGALEGEFDI